MRAFTRRRRRCHLPVAHLLLAALLVALLAALLVALLVALLAGGLASSSGRDT